MVITPKEDFRIHSTGIHLFIYKTTNMLNGKIYVGQHVHDPNERWLEYTGSGKLISRAVKKYGEENFSKELLQECFTQNDLDKAEVFWVKELKATDKKIGYNITPGGQGVGFGENHIGYGKKFSKERCEKISKALRGIKRSEATKEKCRIASIGKPSGNKGKHISEEARQKLIISLRGRKRSAEAIRKHKLATIGQKRSEDTKRKISEARMGIIPWNKGINYADLEKKKIEHGSQEKLINTPEGGTVQCL